MVNNLCYVFKAVKKAKKGCDHEKKGFFFNVVVGLCPAFLTLNFICLQVMKLTFHSMEINEFSATQILRVINFG